MTSATPYWVASCFRAAGAMVGATASMSCSNSARVTTVLQSAGLDLSKGGLSHRLGIVITAASRGTGTPSGALFILCIFLVAYYICSALNVNFMSVIATRFFVLLISVYSIRYLSVVIR